MNTETLEFQAEARQLLQDVFLSELIPNASDALGERRLAGLTDDSLGAVKDVRLTPRLTSSPERLVSDAEEPTVTAELFTDRLTRTVCSTRSRRLPGTRLPFRGTGCSSSFKSHSHCGAILFKQWLG